MRIGVARLPRPTRRGVPGAAPRQRVTVDRGQVGGELVEIPERSRLVDLVQSLGELGRVEPARRMVLAEHVSGAVPVLVGSAHPRFGRHKRLPAPLDRKSSEPTSAVLPSLAAAARRAMLGASLTNPLAPPSSAVSTQGPSVV